MLPSSKYGAVSDVLLTHFFLQSMREFTEHSNDLTVAIYTEAQIKSVAAIRGTPQGAGRRGEASNGDAGDSRHGMYGIVELSERA